MNKYEQLIEHIINDEEDKARALFHDIVVEKSRDIYESLMDEEYAEEDIGGSMTGRLMDEIDADENGGMVEGDDDPELDMEPMDMDDEDPSGDTVMGDADEEDLQQKVMDLESDLEALKAEFEELMGSEAAEEEHSDMNFGSDEEGEEEGGMEFDTDRDEEFPESMYESKTRAPLQKTAVDLMREYVEKISAPTNTEFTPVGTGDGGDKPSGNTKNPVADKNDMGGTAQNIAHGGQGADAHPDGTSPKGKADGKLVKNVQEIDVAKRNVNKPGGNKGAQDFYKTKAKAKAGEGQTTDGSVPTNHRSIEGGGN